MSNDCTAVKVSLQVVHGYAVAVNSTPALQRIGDSQGQPVKSIVLKMRIYVLARDEMSGQSAVGMSAPFQKPTVF
jgi:hypothetical protein